MHSKKPIEKRPSPAFPFVLDHIIISESVRAKMLTCSKSFPINTPAAFANCHHISTTPSRTWIYSFLSMTSHPISPRINPRIAKSRRWLSTFPSITNTKTVALISCVLSHNTSHSVTVSCVEMCVPRITLYHRAVLRLIRDYLRRN
jgi:hypothetical protein